MLSQPSDFTIYLPPSPEVSTWGLCVTGAGRAQIPAGTPYPPGNHPTDRAFDWEHGRVIESLQIVLICSGRGQLETHGRSSQEIDAGSAFVVLPGRWHRYRPDSSSGWEERWIEMEGAIVNSLIAGRVFSPDSPLRKGAILAGLDTAIDALHQALRINPVGFQAEHVAGAMAAIAAWHRCGSMAPGNPPLQLAIAAAANELNRRYAESTDIRKLARKLGIGYSNFRKAFRRQTGLPPWQYVLNLRLTTARRLLASSRSTLKEVAERVGFSSSFHLSTAFKKAYGVSPNNWRKELWKTSRTEEKLNQSVQPRRNILQH